MIDILISFLSIIFIISIPVFLHELGHFLAARSVGIKVEKFYVGINLFGLGIKKKINDTEYGIGLFPLGGYVKVAGIIDESLDSEESDEVKGYEFRSKNTFQKLWFLSAGVIMNFILSIVIYTFLTFFMGTYELANDQPIVNGVQENITILNQSNDTLIVKSPAFELGLQKDDTILRINNNNINNWTDISSNVINKVDSIITIEWKTLNGKLHTGEVGIPGRIGLDRGQIIRVGVLGVSAQTVKKEVGIFEAFKISVIQTYTIIVSSFYGFVGIISGNLDLKYVSGILGIAKQAGDVAQSAGFLSLLALMAFISSNLGLINILPIPGLDGGHALIAIIEGIIRREIPVKIKYGIQFAGFLIIMSLLFLTIFNDVKNIFYN